MSGLQINTRYDNSNYQVGSYRTTTVGNTSWSVEAEGMCDAIKKRQSYNVYAPEFLSGEHLVGLTHHLEALLRVK